MSDGIDYVVNDSVATITLNRPEALNSLTVAMKVALLAALEQARDDDAVRAIVLTGAGRGFCVGQDLNEHDAGLKAGDVELSTVVEHYNPLIEAITTIGKPIIAAVNGMAAGAGASLAFACDLRIAVDTAGFLMAFANVGLGPDSGASWTLQRLVGSGRAAAMLLLANGPTVAYAAIKETLAYSASHSLTESLANEAAAQARCGATIDHAGAVHAFLNKQPPAFVGR
jgi:2-(1,2-epoxy-1,2-dihydrophenyl)acetyl-CoA isomerase